MWLHKNKKTFALEIFLQRNVEARCLFVLILLDSTVWTKICHAISSRSIFNGHLLIIRTSILGHFCFNNVSNASMDKQFFQFVSQKCNQH